MTQLSPAMEKYSLLEDEQRVAFRQCTRHLLGYGSHQHLVFGASAGTGKSFTINALREFLRENNIEHRALAYTGRAASRIQAQTCHSLLYEPILDKNGDLIRWAKIPTQQLKDSVGHGIIVDESSMIPHDMHSDLTKIGVPIIYVGDYAQLPPVDPAVEDGDEPFNPMTSLDVEKVSMVKMRRFAEGSGIAQVAEKLRHENTIPRLKRDDLKIVAKQATLRPEFFEKYEIDAVVCGMNKTRKKYNEIIRRARGFSGREIPQIGETVMCLRNDVIGSQRVNNGELYKVHASFPGKEMSHFILVNEDSNAQVSVDILNHTWDTEQAPRDYHSKKVGQFCFGYAMTSHKCQGSSIPNVLFVDESVGFFLDQRKFRYTACTRASEMLYIAI